MAYGKKLRVGALLGSLAALALPAAAPAQRARITGLTDVAFGTISNFSTDVTASQNVCIHSSASGNRYRVTARGNGTGGSFSLQSGSNTLAYEVQWAGSIGQSVGTNLVANVAQGGFSETGTSQTCLTGGETASLITIMRNAAVSAATAGTYTGTLTLVVAPN